MWWTTYLLCACIEFFTKRLIRCWLIPNLSVDVSAFCILTLCISDGNPCDAVQGCTVLLLPSFSLFISSSHVSPLASAFNPSSLFTHSRTVVFERAIFSFMREKNMPEVVREAYGTPSSWLCTLRAERPLLIPPTKQYCWLACNAVSLSPFVICEYNDLHVWFPLRDRVLLEQMSRHGSCFFFFFSLVFHTSCVFLFSVDVQLSGSRFFFSLREPFLQRVP